MPFPLNDTLVQCAPSYSRRPLHLHGLNTPPPFLHSVKQHWVTNSGTLQRPERLPERLQRLRPLRFPGDVTFPPLSRADNSGGRLWIRSSSMTNSSGTVLES